MFKIRGWPQFLIFFTEITLLCNLSSFNMSRIYHCRFCIKKIRNCKPNICRWAVVENSGFGYTFSLLSYNVGTNVIKCIILFYIYSHELCKCFKPRCKRPLYMQFRSRPNLGLHFETGDWRYTAVSQNVHVYANCIGLT